MKRTLTILVLVSLLAIAYRVKSGNDLPADGDY